MLQPEKCTALRWNARELGLALIAVACAGGCQGVDRAVEPSAAALSHSSGVGATSALAGQPLSARGYPGDARHDERETEAVSSAGTPVGTLPGGHHLEYYVDKPAEFAAMLAGKGWYGWDRQRNCKAALIPECQQGVLLARMRVQAIRDAHLVGWARIPANGVVVGRMMNISTIMDETTEAPGHQAGVSRPFDTHYFVLEPLSSTAATMREAVVSYDPATGAINPRLEIKATTHIFKRCVHPGSEHEPRWQHAEADFRTCTSATGADVSAMNVRQRDVVASSSFSGFLSGLTLASQNAITSIFNDVFSVTSAHAQASGSGGTAIARYWMSCPDGCCSTWP